jgi:hypothetical protein
MRLAAKIDMDVKDLNSGRPLARKKECRKNATNPAALSREAMMIPAPVLLSIITAPNRIKKTNGRCNSRKKPIPPGK